MAAMANQNRSSVKRWFHRLCVAFGAIGMTLAFFLILPLMQAISKRSDDDLVVRSVEAVMPPPETEKIVVEDPPEEDPPPEPPKPELEEANQLIPLESIPLMLDAGGFAGGSGHIDDRLIINTIVSQEAETADVFRMRDLDQKPRVVHQAEPDIDREVRKHAPGTVYIIFIVDENGRVQNPVVQKSDHAVFEKPALDAVKKWRFEPGKRDGQPVRFRMRVPFRFPKG
jgi:protein TonB